MEFTQSVSYPGTVEEVVAMYLTPDYQQRRFGSFIVEGSESVAVEGERITFSGTARPELLPAAASRFVKGALHISFTEEWTRDEAGARSRTRVTGTETGCTREVTGNVSVRVPLLGGRIEKEAVAHLGRVVEHERELAASWLAEHR